MTKFSLLKVLLNSFKSRLYQVLSMGDYSRTILLRCCLLLPLMGTLAIHSTAQDLIERTKLDLPYNGVSAKGNHMNDLVQAAATNSLAPAENSLFSLTSNAGLVASSDLLAEEDVLFLTLNKDLLNAIRTKGTDFLRLKVPVAAGKFIELELIKSIVKSPDYLAESSSGAAFTSSNGAVFYRGVVKGEPNSLAAISIFENSMRGLIMDDDGNYELGKVKNGEDYALFNDHKLTTPPFFDCHVEDTPIEEGIINTVDDQLNSQNLTTPGAIDIYVETDFDMYGKFGSSKSAVETFVMGLFNELATIYQNEQITIKLIKTVVWESTDPYAAVATNAGLIINSFEANRIQFEGVLAMLFSTRMSAGGVAGLDRICSTTAHGLTLLDETTFQPYPAYSNWTNVTAHELGHLFGSRHTHYCAWGPNNNQKIDDCVASEGGSCALVESPIPDAQKGTIMSYCHTVQGGGFNLNKGFGTEPGNLIREKYNNAPCRLNCDHLPAALSTIAAASCTTTTSSEGLGGGFGGLISVAIGDNAVSSSYTAIDQGAFGGDGYLDFTSDCYKAFALDADSTYNITVATWNLDHNVKGWIDYNNNNVFDHPAEQIFDINTANKEHSITTGTGSFTVAASAMTGTSLRMRFLCDEVNNGVTGPCDDPEYGQCEDYAVVIDGGTVPTPCPTDLAIFTTLVVSVTNSICEDRARIPSGGQLTVPEIACPEASTLEYSTDETNWSPILPTYDQENELTIYTRCTCNSDNTVSSSTASVTTIPGEACPAYTFSQFCWEDLTDTWTSFNNLGTDAKGNIYFGANAEDNSPKLYKHDGTTIEDLTPAGGPWSDFEEFGTDRKGIIYFSSSIESNDKKLYSYDGAIMKDLTPAGGPWRTISNIGEDGQGNISFIVYDDFSDRKLYKSDGTIVEDLTPTGGPWSNIKNIGEDGQGNSYFSIYTKNNDQKLYKSVGLSIEDITPVGGPWNSILNRDKDSQGNIYFFMYAESQDVKLYKSDDSTLVNLTPVGGPWVNIFNQIVDRQGNIYFSVIDGSNEYKLYKNDGTTMEEITPEGGPWSSILNRGEDSQGNSYFFVIDESNDRKLYKYDGTKMEDFTPAGGPWIVIENRGEDSQGNSYFSIFAEYADQKLYKSDGTSIEDITPTGGPWIEIENIIADGQGNIYFSIFAEYADRKLYKYDGTTMKDFTPAGGPWNVMNKIAQDDNGNIYFSISAEYNNQKLYRSNGTTMEDITPMGGPWGTIQSIRKYSNGTRVSGEVTGLPVQGNNYFVIYTDYIDRKLYKSNGTMIEDMTPSGGSWSDIYYLSDNDGKGNIYINTADEFLSERLFYNYPGPCPNQLTVTNLLASSVELQWQDKCETANEWEIEYGTEGFMIGTGTKITVTEKPYSLEKLLPNTDYEFYVRANCGGSEGTSDWSLAKGFNTTAKISVNDAALLEGDEGQQNLVFTLTLSALSDKTLAIEYFTEDLTATAGVDYEAIPKTTLNFNPGEFIKTIEVPVFGDLTPETNELFYLVIKQVQPEVLASAFAPTGTPLLGDGVALGYILNDDFSEANQGVTTHLVCGTEVALNGTAVAGTTTGTWAVLHSTDGVGSFADENSSKSTYSGNIGSRDSLLWQLSINGTITSQDTMIVEFSPDSDEDGVQDCVDACLDGNDQLDSDGDGAPDECDCNPNDAEDSFVTVDAVGDETLFQSSNRLLSNAVIGTGLDITFLAGQSITLNSGFHAVAGSHFLAKLGPCQNPVGKVFKEVEGEATEMIASSRMGTNLSSQLLAKGSINLTVQPNPIRQEAMIGIELPINTMVSLTLYDLNGRLLKTLLRTTEQAAGMHHFSLQAGYLPSGMYLLQLRSATEVISKKIVVQR